MAALLSFQDLMVAFRQPKGGLVRVVHGVDLDLSEGEILGLVGESGSGKSVTCMSALQLAGPMVRTEGRILFEEQDLLDLDEANMAALRGRGIGMIFQDPMTALNPVLTIGRQVGEAVRLARPELAAQGRPAVEAEALRLLGEVGIGEPRRRLKQYPHELSGGLNQRAMIAMTLAGRPRVLIADEPTTALDATVQAQILMLLRDLRDRFGMSILLITHDLGVVAQTCDRVAVMYCGRIVEDGAVGEVFASPSHPYTAGLLTSRPRTDRGDFTLRPIPGIVPAPDALPTGCAFAPRCMRSSEICRNEQPRPREKERRVACFHPLGASQ